MGNSHGGSGQAGAVSSAQLEPSMHGLFIKALEGVGRRRERNRPPRR